jgi:hypothetical protein
MFVTARSDSVTAKLLAGRHCESRVPIVIAPIDHRTCGEQLDMLDELGDSDDCSPYGCRSGEPVVGT